MALTWYSEVRKHPSNTSGATNRELRGVTNKAMSFPHKNNLPPCAAAGGSRHKPYCDGSHEKHDWDPQLTAAPEPILEGAKKYEGPRITLYDNEKYCAFARFCDAYGRIWNLVLDTDSPEAQKIIEHEAHNCPAGRLVIRDNATGKIIEKNYEPSLGLIEDDPINASGPLWVRGGIRIDTEDGRTYRIRNRVTLCRCGQSSNKPFCDGTHASFNWDDGLRKKMTQ